MRVDYQAMKRRDAAFLGVGVAIVGGLSIAYATRAAAQPPPPPNGPPPPPEGAILIIDGAFSPDVFEAEPGQQITWFNLERTTHTVTSNSAEWFFDVTLQPDQSVTLAVPVNITVPFSIEYFSRTDPGMTGVIQYAPPPPPPPVQVNLVLRGYDYSTIGASNTIVQGVPFTINGGPEGFRQGTTTGAPLVFQCTSGNTYLVTAGDPDNWEFAQWSNGDTNRERFFEPTPETGTASWNAYYDAIVVAPPPPPPPSGHTGNGLYMPLYTAAISQAAIAANVQLAGYPNLFTANPWSGPFLVFPGNDPPPWQFATPENRDDILQRLITLKQDNPDCKIIGYIATDYGEEGTPRETMAGIFAQIEAWVVWNDPDQGGVPGLIDGIMLDEYGSTADKLPFYIEVRDKIRAEFAASGVADSVIRGNQGGPFHSDLHLEFNCVDVAVINENNFIPEASESGEALMQQRTFHGKFHRSRFNWLTHSRASETWTDAQYRLIQKYCATSFITDRVFGEDPWADAPDSMQRQVNLILTQPPPPDEE